MFHFEKRVCFSFYPSPGVLQGSRCGDRKMSLFDNKAINFIHCLEYHLKLSRIQVFIFGFGETVFLHFTPQGGSGYFQDMAG
ncbi:hypothetical protein BMS3Abin13_00826 [bacterium BMS3Abin13]|nr:hypothetical protein BMS3Abin13_00826 [bacterium BMS3Abin13]